jgi:hypothetical protein
MAMHLSSAPGGQSNANPARWPWGSNKLAIPVLSAAPGLAISVQMAWFMLFLMMMHHIFITASYGQYFPL